MAEGIVIAGVELPLYALAAAVAVLLGLTYIISGRLRDYRQQLEQLEPKQKPKEFGVYTCEEVAKHNKEGDAWIIVRHKETKEWRVYDITEYVVEHPGGNSILRNAGYDATEGVYGPQHPVTTFLLMEEYLIGKLAEGEQPQPKPQKAG